MGVLSALPIIAAGNACCCLWVVGGGALSAYLLQQNWPGTITAGDGALVGLMAGIIGAFVQTALSIPIDILMAPFQREMLQRIVDMAGTMPPEISAMVEQYRSQSEQMGPFAIAARGVIGLFLALIAGMIFSTLGGLLGAALFAKRQPPPSPLPPQGG
jgi:hypothetical protein